MNCKLLTAAALAITLVGCASTSTKPTAKVEPSIEPFNEVVISYTPTNYALVTKYTGRGATGLGNLGGLLGPLGLLAAVAIDQAVEAGVASKNLERTEALDKTIKGKAADWDVNRVQAEYIGAKIAQETGAQVKLLARASTASGVAAPAALADKQARVELESVTGYGAVGTTDSFKPIVITKYSVQVGNPARVVLGQELVTFQPANEETYMTWAGVLADAEKVPAMAQRQLRQHADKINTELLAAWQRAKLKANAPAASAPSSEQKVAAVQ
ncbi:hypothetical protein [Chitinibacter tainanensis]|uniref:hypothetical protein n=1 Tax=Chitinibacter tainanensis TaxID=230667 RepID=UPI0023521446|nr:hypothetical protein [Chitinibacter tainanensis]